MISQKAKATQSSAPGKIICIYGESGSGKTFLATRLKSIKDCIILDGDAVRHYCHHDLGFSEEDRRKNNTTIADWAIMLSKQGYDVVISTIRADVAYSHIKENAPELNAVKVMPKTKAADELVRLRESAVALGNHTEPTAVRIASLIPPMPA